MKKITFKGSSTLFFFALIVFSAGIISCKEKDAGVVKPKTITDVILNNAEFSILKEIMMSTGMSDALRTEELTIFAPNDAAFKLSGISNASAITSLPNDSARSFLKYHILGKRLLYNDIPTGKNKTLNGGTLSITKKDSTLTINHAFVTVKNMKADNGTIQVIDRVLTFNK